LNVLNENLESIAMTNGTSESYDVIIKRIDELIAFLKSLNVEAELHSHLENDYLAAHSFYQEYKSNPGNIDFSVGRQALGGLHELYKWIWAVKDLGEFNKLNQHLELLVQCSPRINSASTFLNPVTKKTDDKTNKFIEAIIGFFAVACGTEVELDDPIKSSDGNNPDVIFTFENKKVSVACKTLWSTAPMTIVQNIKSAAEQISRADCESGYIFINVMNVIEHSVINNKIFNSVEEPLTLIHANLKEIYQPVIDGCKKEMSEIFSLNPKAIPTVITVLHSVTRINSINGVLSTSLKLTVPVCFLDTCNVQSMRLPNMFNDFIHNRIP